MNTLFSIVALLIGPMLGMQASASPASAITATWVHTAQGLRFTMKPTKQVVHSDGPVIVEFIYTNVGKTPKILETGAVFVNHSIEVFCDGERIPPDVRRIESAFGGWSRRPSGRIPRGGNLTEELDLGKTRDMSRVGTYRVTARKFFRPTLELSEVKNPRIGIDYLEAETSFRVIPATQSLGSVAVPSEDLKVRLFYQRDGKGKKKTAGFTHFSVTNSGQEPWFLSPGSDRNGIQFEITDKKGRVLDLTEKGKALALIEPTKKFDVTQAPVNLDLLPTVTLQTPDLQLNDYTQLVPGDSYKVGIIWKGTAFRSTSDRRGNNNAVAFEIRSAPIVVTVPRN